ncbi:MAG: pyridoxal 5'-phosphate synthase glutaminase subunit PdxT [Candidatus Marinimicrobia bacterium]|nr:pyridoxal 5'-phosphate synthase glutaminase subunit PdxT [Candidatus Neomarinimicrobiota bacterium]
MTELHIGVLGIQGACSRHAEILSSAGVPAVMVKYREQLREIDGLIIPGGESTTMTKMMDFRIGYDDIREYGKDHPIFGTCAGLIMLGRGCNDPRVRQLGFLDAGNLRNAYGSQKESFIEEISLTFDPDKSFHAVFIRAPQIESTGKSVRVLARYEHKPVLIESGIHLGASFHPELTADTRIHRYFIQKVKEIKNEKTTRRT